MNLKIFLLFAWDRIQSIVPDRGSAGGSDDTEIDIVCGLRLW